MKKLFKTPILVLLTLAASCASAAPIVATPGSMAGYTYFPKAQSTSGGSGGSGTDNVGTLQRCFWTPPAADHTVTLSASNWYDYGDSRELTVYYKLAGGDGGAGHAGGGGGSSALLKNGSIVAIGPGGTGNYDSTRTAPITEGSFKVTKADTLRFITGGGGGDGAEYSSTGYNTIYALIGGGGGAGYTGGGGGASSSSPFALSSRNLAAGMGGKGGDTVPGAGGLINSLPSGNPGTAGSGQNGGVATYSNGSSAPVGSWTSGSATFYCDSCSGAYRFPATPTRNGSHGPFYTYFTSGYNLMFPGGGGQLGSGGTTVGSIYYDSYQTSGQILTSPGPTPSMQERSGVKSGYTISLYPAPTSFSLTKGVINGSGLYGSLPGQIVMMYQAPVCSILK